MNELASLGLILLLALLAGHLVQILRIPEVTGYILAGIALGPSALGWVSHENLQALGVLSEVALGLILFSIGSVFEYNLLLRFGRRILRLTLMESALAAVLVTGAMLALGQSWQLACLLGAISIATAPASTLMVIRECNGRGPLSDTLLGIIAINNICCIIAYSLVAAAIEMTAGWQGLGSLPTTIYESLFPLVWQLVGSVALGFMVGLMLAGWATQVKEGGEMLILLAGSILLCVGVSRMIDLEPLVASLAVGATMVNLSQRSRRLFHTLAGTDPPFYAIFFVIAGADLDLASVPEMGLLGVAYLSARAIGKFLGGLSADTNYYLLIRAVDDNGTSTFVGEFTTVTPLEHPDQFGGNDPNPGCSAGCITHAVIDHVEYDSAHLTMVTSMPASPSAPPKGSATSSPRWACGRAGRGTAGDPSRVGIKPSWREHRDGIAPATRTSTASWTTPRSPRRSPRAAPRRGGGPRSPCISCGERSVTWDPRDPGASAPRPRYARRRCWPRPRCAG